MAGTEAGREGGHGARGMKVLVLAPAIYDTAPGQRYRIEQWARYLAREGIQFTFSPFEDERLQQVLYQPGSYGKKVALLASAFLRRLRVVKHARDYDVVFLFREAATIGPAIIERLVARRGIPIVYDFDDPIWLPYRSPTNKFFARLKFPGKTAAICRRATVVVVGNELLATYAREHARQVSVVPTTMDLERYPCKSEGAGAPLVTVGWTGSHSTLPFLELLSGILKRLAERQRFRMLVISHTSAYRLDGVAVPMTARRWESATEGADLQEMDVGVAPFPNTGWTPWRCHGKVLQYMAAAIPVVASPVGVVNNYIQDGTNGFLAETEDEWLDKLSLLIEKPELRRAMGLAGRETVEERYSAHVWVPKVREILESAAARRETA